jgi:hypothetical protein
MKYRNFTVKPLVIAATVVGASLAQSVSFAETVASKWNSAALEAIRITHPGPPIVARSLAVANTCMFDA